MAKSSALRRYWSISRITSITELSSVGRLTSTAFHIALPLWLTVLVWRGLYSERGTVAGVTVDQALTYAVIAALLTYLRVGDRRWVRDDMPQHVRLGTVTYWYLWPLRPAAYHVIRAIGDTTYAVAWALPALVLCLVLGVVAPPVDLASGVLTVISVAFGQAVAYLIGLVLDLLCFWTLLNDSVIRMVGFIQALMAGGFAPLWFFPTWFQVISRALPFASIVSTPITIYLTRSSGRSAILLLLEQLMWCVVLGIAAAMMWRAARNRVEVFGG